MQRFNTKSFYIEKFNRMHLTLPLVHNANSLHFIIIQSAGCNFNYFRSAHCTAYIHPLPSQNPFCLGRSREAVSRWFPAITKINITISKKFWLISLHQDSTKYVQENELHNTSSRTAYNLLVKIKITRNFKALERLEHATRASLATQKDEERGNIDSHYGCVS